MMLAHAGLIAQAGASAPLLTLPTANLLAAWDARVGVTNVSGACSAWADQSGNGWHALQGTAGQRPAISTSGGTPSLRFNGTNHWLSVASIAASAGTKTIYAVVDPAFDAGSRAIIDINVGRLFCGGYQSKYQGFDGSWRDTGVAVTTGRQRLEYQVATGALSFWKDGSAATPVAWGTAPAIGGGCAIGSAYLGNSLFFSGHILWLGVYTAARNTAVGAYLTQEYGV